MERTRVFISSASGALREYRNAAIEICQRLGLDPVFMEEFDPERAPPLDVCRRKVESCHAIVLLLAHRFGSRPRGDSRSFTEIEYDTAMACRPPKNLLAFVIDPTFPWPPSDLDAGSDREALTHFAARVQELHMTRPFGDIGKFREELLVVLRRFEATPSRGSRESLIPKAPAFHATPPYVGSTQFTGRIADLERLDSWARSSDPVMVVEAIGGTGKSALTWEWGQSRAETVIDGYSGGLWWSFYGRSASITRFMQEVLVYVSELTLDDVRKIDRTELVPLVLAAVRERPLLLVLDGIERLLYAYHRFDPSTLLDEEVDANKRALIEPNADAIVRELAAAGPSKVLISTRLIPSALQRRGGQMLPGVSHLRLPGLSDDDTEIVLRQLDVSGDRQTFREFFRPLGNHPLLVGIVAGLVNDYRPEPGGFERWLADPAAGGRLRIPDLDLTERRSHILEASLRELTQSHRLVLGWIAELPGAVEWNTLEAINPFLPPEPSPVKPEPLGAEIEPEDWFRERRRLEMIAEQETIARRAAWLASEDVTTAPAKLIVALGDLEDRGLLWWDRHPSNAYDLHPIVRAFARDQLLHSERVLANERVRDHFQALPAEDIDRVRSVEDLTQTITLFGAMVRANQFESARVLWGESLARPLLVVLGAHTTAAELLAPLAMADVLHARADLAVAHHHLGLHDKAVELETRTLALCLESGRGVHASLRRLAVALGGIGHRAQRFRCMTLEAELVDLLDDDGLRAGVALSQANEAIRRGDTDRGLELLDQAEALGAPANNPWFRGSLESFRLYVGIVTGQRGIRAQLETSFEDASLWLHRWELANYRCTLCRREGDFKRALAAAEERDRLAREGDVRTVPAELALAFAKMRRRSEASEAVSEALDGLDRVHAAKRPHLALAEAFEALESEEEAGEHALLAYRQAWSDGPPYCDHWHLEDASALLGRLAIPEPALPIVDPATVRIPSDPEVRIFIASIGAK